MPLDSDFALLGTGVAPLVAANQLAAQGYSVLLVNPDKDFFMENSELGLDPFWPMDKSVFSRDRLFSSHPEKVIEELRPTFPGAVEFWSDKGPTGGFHDPTAPQVRQRSRLWVVGPESPVEHWDFFESLFIDAEDWDLKPQIYDGIQSVARFPGMSLGSGTEHCRGLMIPASSDFDVVAYREGLLEFVRERLADRVICGAGQIEAMPGGLRFTVDGKFQTPRVRHGILAFWTPRMSSWILQQAKERELDIPVPKVRLWENWSLASREPLDPRVIGTYRNMTVWAEVEGDPWADAGSGARRLHRLSVLLAGPLLDLPAIASKQHGLSWADENSFEALTTLCCGFLNWDRFSVRSMRPKAIFEWGGEPPEPLLFESDPPISIVTGCDGPLVHVVTRARALVERLQQTGGSSASL